jgi:hypothetical protein
MKQTASRKKSTSSPVEPVIVSRLQRATAAQIAREQARELWRRRALRILLGAVVAAMALRVLTIAVQPCLAAYHSTQEIKALRVRLHNERERRQRLLARIDFLKSDHGVEEEARKLGWTRAGEVSLQLVTPESEARPRPPTAASKPLPSRVSGSERLRAALTRWLEGLRGGQ